MVLLYDTIEIRLLLFIAKTGFSSGLPVKNPFAVQEPEETKFRSLGWKDPLKEGMATHSSILAWRIPWTEEPDGPRSMGVAKSQTKLKRLSIAKIISHDTKYLLHHGYELQGIIC